MDGRGGRRSATSPAIGEQSSVLDLLVLGEPSSESEHGFEAEEGRSTIDGGRRSLPLDPPAARLADLSFDIAVDPVRDVFLTLELEGDDDSALKTIVLIDGVLTSYRQLGDHEPIDTGSRSPAPGRRFRTTQLLPPSCVRGRRSVRIALRTYAVGYRPLAGDAGHDVADAPSRRFGRVWSSVEPVFAGDPPPEPPGTGPTEPRPARDPEADRSRVQQLRERQRAMFDELERAVDAGRPWALTLSRYQDGMRFYADALVAPWSPAASSVARERALRRVVAAIDHWAGRYHADVRSAASGGHQSDWGGYYSVIGEVLYTLEPLIDDTAVLGRPAFEALLDEPLPLDTVDGPYSVAGRDTQGAPLRRRKVWERMLAASFDFARSRLSYIFNQMMLTYEGAWRAHEGLRIVGSDRYEGRERSHRILREAFGVDEFLGEEVLTDRDGGAIDLSHSLFHHDRNIELTDDVIRIVLRGEARSALDCAGRVVRRRPYGDHYRGLTRAGLTRENGYVGVYGELILLIVPRIRRLRDHAEDVPLHDALLHAALRNAGARLFFRYQGLDPDGHRSMLMEQVVDERNSAFPGRVAYDAEAVSGSSLLWAGLGRESGIDLESATHARAIRGAVRQMLLDDQLLPAFDLGNDVALRNDLEILETYHWLTRGPAAHERSPLLPHAEPAAYTDAELEQLGVDRSTVPARLCFVDLENAIVSVRDGDDHLWAALAFRNAGMVGVGRAHLRTAGSDWLTQFTTRAESTARELHVRGETREAWRQDAPDRIGEGRPFAWTGEVSAVAFQPGIGTVRRDNFVFDTPFSGRPEVVSAVIGDWFVAMNTTEPDLGNARTATIPLPAALRTGNLVDGTDVRVGGDGVVELPPSSAFVARLEGRARVDPAAVPLAVGVSAAGSTAISWPRVPFATAYEVAIAGGDPVLVPESSRSPHLLLPGRIRSAAIASVGRGGGASITYAVMIQVAPTSTDGWSLLTIGGAEGELEEREGRVVFRVGHGRFAGGDDARVHQRFQGDALGLAVGRLAADPLDVEATILRRSTGWAGLVVRDGLDAIARSIAVGTGEDGRVEVRTRTLDTREDIGIGNPGGDASGGETRSPWRAVFDLEELPVRVRLTREHAAGPVTAWIHRRDGWEPIWSGIVPMLPIAVVGLAATGRSTVELVDPRGPLSEPR